MDAENIVQPGVVPEHGDLGKGGGGGIPPGAFPQKLDHIQGDVVEHQGQQGFIGAEPGFEEGGNQPPEAAADHAGQQHGRQQQPVGPVAVKNAEIGGGDRAHDDLSLAADVPEFHLEGEA